MAHIHTLGNKTPHIHETAMIAPTAVIIGDVTIDEGVSIWPNVVIRGDIAPIHVGAYTNIQDNSTLHADIDTPLTIEPYVLIGHNCMVHGSRVGECTLIGMCSCVMGWTEVGKECIVGAYSLVTQGKKIPDRSLVFGNPAKIIRSTSDEDVAGTKHGVTEYYELSRQYTDWKV